MTWRRRFLVPLVGMPDWALDAADRLVYPSNQSGSWQIHAWDRERGSHRQATSHPTGARFARITSDGRTICWFADQDGTETGRWMRQPFSGGEDEPLAVDVPAGWRTGLALGERGLMAVGVMTAEGCEIRIGRVGHDTGVLYRSSKPAVPADFSRDGRLLAVSHAEDGHAARPALRVFDVDTGVVVSELTDGRQHGITGPLFSPLRGDQRVAFLHERADLVRPGVWDPLGGVRLDAGLDLPGDIEIVDWHPDGDRLVIVHSYRGRDEAYWLDIETGSTRQLPHPAGTITDIAVRPDGETWLRRSSGGIPPQVECLRTGVSVLGPDQRAAGADYHAWQFRNEAGDQVHGFLAAPRATGPHRTVLLVHGGPHQHDADAWNPRVQALVDDGWAVAMLNYRGSTGRGKAWLDLGVGDPGRPQVQDIVAARRALVERGVSDRDAIVLAGGSWGGYLTLLTIGMVPDGWRSAVAIAPLADLIMAYREQSPPLRHLLEMIFGGPPEQEPARYRDRSPVSYVGQVRTPVLIVAGEHDSRCPMRQVDSYVAQLRQAGGEVELTTYPSGHGSLVRDEQILQLERMLEFIGRTQSSPPSRR